MILYSSPQCVHSHRVRFVLCEKSIAAKVVHIDPLHPPAELVELNPYADTPTLVDRDLVLYDSRIIMEYLDERFPHPPLHPLDPVSRARARLFIHRIERDWYSLYQDICTAGEKKSMRLRKLLRESLLAGLPIFSARPFFMSEEFSLVDCAVAPLLWRLPELGIDLPGSATALHDYARRMFARTAFQASLSDRERALPALV